MCAVPSIQCAIFHERGAILNALEPSGTCRTYLTCSVMLKTQNDEYSQWLISVMQPPKFGALAHNTRHLTLVPEDQLVQQ
jgi:hypothetical protein